MKGEEKNKGGLNLGAYLETNQPQIPPPLKKS